MTRKDFQLIADALAATKPVNQGQAALDAWYSTIRVLAERLRTANPAFKRDTFLAACEPK